MKVVTVTSGSRGGTGKTTILLNVALLHAYVSYINNKNYILLTDAEFQEGTATYRISPELSLKYKEGKIKSLIDFILDEADIREIIKVAVFKPDKDTRFPVLLTSAMTLPSKYKALQKMDLGQILDRLELLIKELSKLLPIEAIYIDMPATRIHETFSIALFALSDFIIPIGVPDPTSLLTLYTTVTAIRDYIKPPPTINVAVVNRITIENSIEPHTGKRYTDLYRKLLGVRFVVAIPDDPNLSATSAAGMIEILSERLKNVRSIKRLKKLASYVIEHELAHVPKRVINLEYMHKFLSLGYKTNEEAEAILLALYRARRRIPIE